MTDLKNIHSAFIEQIKAALNTQEDGAALIEVARNAHKAEQELAAFKCRIRDMGWTFEAAYARLT